MASSKSVNLLASGMLPWPSFQVPATVSVHFNLLLFAAHETTRINICVQEMDRCFLQCFVFFCFLDFSPDFECETSHSPVPSPLFSNSLTKFPLEALVHPENPSADLVSLNSEPIQT